MNACELEVGAKGSGRRGSRIGLGGDGGGVYVCMYVYIYICMCICIYRLLALCPRLRSRGSLEHWSGPKAVPSQENGRAGGIHTSSTLPPPFFLVAFLNCPVPVASCHPGFQLLLIPDVQSTLVPSNPCTDPQTRGNPALTGKSGNPRSRAVPAAESFMVRCTSGVLLTWYLTWGME